MADAAIQHRDAHEQRDISRRGLLLFGLTFAALIAISVVVLWLIFGRQEGGFSAAQQLGSIPNDSELGQRQQLSQYLDRQNAELDRLAWTDHTKQFAKVPIEDAMRMLAAKGAAR